MFLFFVFLRYTDSETDTRAAFLREKKSSAVTPRLPAVQVCNNNNNNNNSNVNNNGKQTKTRRTRRTIIMWTNRRRRHDGIVASIVAVALMAGSLCCQPASAATAAVDRPAAAVVGNGSSSDAAATTATATGRSDADLARTPPLRPSLVRAVTAFLPFVTAAAAAAAAGADRSPQSRCSKHTGIYMSQLNDFKLWAAQSKHVHVPIIRARILLSAGKVLTLIQRSSGVHRCNFNFKFEGTGIFFL